MAPGKRGTTRPSAPPLFQRLSEKLPTATAWIELVKISANQWRSKLNKKTSNDQSTIRGIEKQSRPSLRTGIHSPTLIRGNKKRIETTDAVSIPFNLNPNVALIQPLSRIKPLRPFREHDGEGLRYLQLPSLYPRSLTSKAREQFLVVLVVDWSYHTRIHPRQGRPGEHQDRRQ